MAREHELIVIAIGEWPLAPDNKARLLFMTALFRHENFVLHKARQNVNA
jgi:hypothetical protein